MQIELINQHYIENLEKFKIPVMKRGWDILIMVVDGTYIIHIEDRKNSKGLKPAELKPLSFKLITCQAIKQVSKTQNPAYS